MYSVTIALTSCSCLKPIRLCKKGAIRLSGITSVSYGTYSTFAMISGNRAVSDGVVRRLIEGLGWPHYDTQVVFP